MSKVPARWMSHHAIQMSAESRTALTAVVQWTKPARREDRGGDLADDTEDAGKRPEAEDRWSHHGRKAETGVTAAHR